MPLAVCADLSPADWIVASDLPWPRLVTSARPASLLTRVFGSFLTPSGTASRRTRRIWTHRLTRLTNGGICCGCLLVTPLTLTTAISVSGRVGGSRNRYADGPPSVFLVAPDRLRGPTSCFTDHSRRPRSRSGDIPPTPESGAYRSSPEAVRPRSSGLLTTRGASPQTLTHTGQRSAHLRR